MLFQTQGPHEKHQKHKSQSTTSEPALSYLTRSENLSTLKNKSNIVELCETIDLKAPQKASRHYNWSQSFQTQVFKAKMYLLGPNQWKQLPGGGGVIPKENGTCSLGCFQKSLTLSEKKKNPHCNSKKKKQNKKKYNKNT